MALEFGLSASSWHLWTLPMFHCNGWSLTWGVTTVGATHVCLPSFDADRALDLIARYPVTHLCGAPVVLSELARAGSRRSFVAARPVRAAVGGAPPTKETIAAVQQMGIQVTHLYGLTETYGPSLVCEYQPGWAGPARRGPGRAAQPAGGTHRVRGRRAGRRRGPGPGASRTAGPWARSWSGPTRWRPATSTTSRPRAEAFRGGWFHTGDLAVMHPDGYIELTDRSKDVIISGGENIASVEVEKVLAAHPEVIEAAVVAVPDERWGERPVAFVTTAGGAVTERELTDFVRGRLAHFKAPDRVYFEALPKTSTGKIQKHVLRAVARERARDGGPA